MFVIFLFGTCANEGRETLINYQQQHQQQQNTIMHII